MNALKKKLLKKLAHSTSDDCRAIQLVIEILNCLSMIFPRKDEKAQYALKVILFDSNQLFEAACAKEKLAIILELKDIFDILLKNKKHNLLELDMFLKRDLPFAKRNKLKNQMNKVKKNVEMLEQIMPMIDALESLYDVSGAYKDIYEIIKS